MLSVLHTPKILWESSLCLIVVPSLVSERLAVLSCVLRGETCAALLQTGIERRGYFGKGSLRIPRHSRDSRKSRGSREPEPRSQLGAMSSNAPNAMLARLK